MTSPAVTAPPQTDPSRSGDATVESTSSMLRGARRRWQFWVLLLVIGTLIAVAQQLLTRQDLAPYSLGSTEQDGYGAVAEVLEDQGVTIHEVAGADQLRRSLSEHPEATLVSFEADWPMDPQVREELVSGDLAEDTGWRGASVLLSPGGETLEAAASASSGRIRPAPSAAPGADGGEPLPAGASCPLAAARTAGSVADVGTRYRTDLPACFTADAASPEEDGADGGAEDTAGEESEQAAALAPPQGRSDLQDPADQLPTAALVVTEAGVVFGSPEVFTNSRIAEEGHAALGLQLFGQDEELIWYRTTQADVADAGASSPWDHLPDWVGTLQWWLLICAAVLILVAGRRRGPVIAEPLPVEVPASETAEGRARLYQQADAAGPAARTLRSAHMLRLTRLLRLGPAAEPAIIQATAATTGADPAQIARRLDASTVSSSSDLLRFAQDLAALEDEVRIRTGLGPRRAETAPAGPVAGGPTPETRFPLKPNDPTEVTDEHSD